MSHKYRRDEKHSSTSHYDKAKDTIRNAFNKSSNEFHDKKQSFGFHLYENDREQRINAIVDDEDGDLVVERQVQPVALERSSRIIEANDRRHDAVIFGDKATEEQQKSELYNSFKQSSKYSTASLAGHLLLEDPENKRLRWKNKMRDLWIQRNGMKTANNAIDTD